MGLLDHCKTFRYRWQLHRSSVSAASYRPSPAKEASSSKPNGLFSERPTVPQLSIRGAVGS
jgi:hypothetical protein